MLKLNTPVLRQLYDAADALRKLMMNEFLFSGMYGGKLYIVSITKVVNGKEIVIATEGFFISKEGKKKDIPDTICVSDFLAMIGQGSYRVKLARDIGFPKVSIDLRVETSLFDNRYKGVDIKAFELMEEFENGIFTHMKYGQENFVRRATKTRPLLVSLF